MMPAVMRSMPTRNCARSSWSSPWSATARVKGHCSGRKRPQPNRAVTAERRAECVLVPASQLWGGRGAGRRGTHRTARHRLPAPAKQGGRSGHAPAQPRDGTCRAAPCVREVLCRSRIVGGSGDMVNLSWAPHADTKCEHYPSGCVDGDASACIGVRESVAMPGRLMCVSVSESEVWVQISCCTRSRSCLLASRCTRYLPRRKVLTFILSA